jgi:hypothetical protein
VRRLIALLIGSLLSSAAQAEPIAVTSQPVASFQRIGSATNFGPFAWRGGLVLDSADPDFGGLSGLSVGGSCDDLLAVSDRGTWLRAKLGYDGDGRLASIAETEQARILDAKGKPFATKSRADAEALSYLGKGHYLVGFERHERVGLFDIGRKGLKARFKLVPSPKMISEGPTNGELESIGRLTRGRYGDHFIAIAEAHRDADGNTFGWLWKSWKTIPFTVAKHADYAITDLATLPNGKVLILERSFSPGSLPGMAIRRFDPEKIEPWGLIEPELLFEGRLPLYAIDNMEGIAVCERGGETRVTLVSDDNFKRDIQSTLLLQFAYRP